MKRTIPLFITAIGGFILIVSVFIPRTEGWGEIAAIWFDVLAAIAFVLGGGNLIKIHLKKISDRAKGWAYSAITLIAFFATLYFGLFKVGSKPAEKQEFYGEVFATVPLDELPAALTFEVDGKIPERGDGEPIPASVRKQLSQEGGRLVFRGWMTGDQKSDLIAYDDTLEWRCTVEGLFSKAQPPEALKGKVTYYTDHRALAFSGRMQNDHEKALLALGESKNETWKSAVESLKKSSNETHSISVESLPKGVTIPANGDVTFKDGKLSIVGPMSASQRDSLARQFPISRPLIGEKRDAFLKELESGGEALSSEQKDIFNKTLDGGWTVAQLTKAVNDAGKVPEVKKSACAMLREFEDGVKEIKSKENKGKEVSLNDAQKEALAAFAADTGMSKKDLIDRLKAAGDWETRQAKALNGFLSRLPTIGERNARLATALMKAGPISDQQREFLTADYKRQEEWKATVGRLYVAAHTVKYAWSGEYRETGSPFWWMYEYAFKPLTATMFAMLAFYVASAAFRAFRAKNVEAALLLGTAFIILLGRTFAGVLLTSWMPEALSGLRIERLTVYIMQVFNTAGSRAIMIGISLGVVSTSLKVLLGVDRSYLGSAED